MYVMAVETKPEAQAFRVAHHITTNLIEDEDDPTGLFFNEYALGKNGDIFPRDSGRLIKAGSKINFNLHLHPYGQATDVQASLGLKLFPKGAVPKYVAFTQHMGDVADLDLPAGEITRSDGYFRLSKPALISAFQPHMHNRGKAQCMEAIYPDVRADSARPGPARTETLSCVSNYQFGWHITYPYADEVAPLLPAGTIIHITSWHDNTTANKYNPNPKNWVGSGQRTIDEMAFAWVSLTYLDQADFDRRVAAPKCRRAVNDAVLSRDEAFHCQFAVTVASAGAERSVLLVPPTRPIAAAAHVDCPNEVRHGPGRRARVRGLDPEPGRQLRPGVRLFQSKLQRRTGDSRRSRQHRRAGRPRSRAADVLPAASARTALPRPRPSDWGQKVLTWTITANGRTEKAYGDLLPVEEINEQIIMSGGNNVLFGDEDPNKPPAITVAPCHRRASRNRSR